jgi:hypothetical protein
MSVHTSYDTLSGLYQTLVGPSYPPQHLAPPPGNGLTEDTFSFQALLSSCCWLEMVLAGVESPTFRDASPCVRFCFSVLGPRRVGAHLNPNFSAASVTTLCIPQVALQQKPLLPHSIQINSWTRLQADVDTLPQPMPTNLEIPWRFVGCGARLDATLGWCSPLRSTKSYHAYSTHWLLASDYIKPSVVYLHQPQPYLLRTFDFDFFAVFSLSSISTEPLLLPL